MNVLVIREPKMYPWGTPGVTLVEREEFLWFTVYKIVRASIPNVGERDTEPHHLARGEYFTRRVVKFKPVKTHTNAETLEDLKKFL